MTSKVRLGLKHSLPRPLIPTHSGPSRLQATHTDATSDHRGRERAWRCDGLATTSTQLTALPHPIRAPAGALPGSAPRPGPDHDTAGGARPSTCGRSSGPCARTCVSGCGTRGKAAVGGVTRARVSAHAQGQPSAHALSPRFLLVGPRGAGHPGPSAAASNRGAQPTGPGLAWEVRPPRPPLKQAR